jgi:hypothetical protein
MATNPSNDTEVYETVDSSVLQAITKAELDQQITTARAYPRSITGFQKESMEIVRLNEDIAKECVYMLPRDGKIIEGPSSRLAEIVASCWGNCRASARVVNEDAEFITAQGVFHDLERNVAISMEVRRRITTKNGGRYGADMIATTGNAACSIALRNAVFKGIPKAYWRQAFTHAKAVMAGDPNTLDARRKQWIDFLKAKGVPEANIYATLEVPGRADIGMEHLAILEGIQNAVKEGDTTFAEAFGVKTNGEKPRPAAAAIAKEEVARTAAAASVAEVLNDDAAGDAPQESGDATDDTPADASDDPRSDEDKAEELASGGLDAVLTELGANRLATKGARMFLKSHAESGRPILMDGALLTAIGSTKNGAPLPVWLDTMAEKNPKMWAALCLAMVKLRTELGIGVAA